ncbi:hypothetical protein SeLEV6574_g01339 [Synchytrium endobioticum]|uniref:Expansin-like EG45 domain-containing protein n=1 Tax=Synchytrium endobioticum TaxID=286115 RepID=A0A507DFT8_9FUNG|nr:hypothetical protein SeLEV6574_g01339 [Synchytrium endobioticum]
MPALHVVYGTASLRVVPDLATRLAKRGRATWYDANELGSCGGFISNSDAVCAMSTADYSGAQCGRCLTISGSQGSASCYVKDECPGCPSGGLDLTPEVFKKISGGNLSVGVLAISYASCGSTNAVSISDINDIALVDGAGLRPSGGTLVAIVVCVVLSVLAVVGLVMRKWRMDSLPPTRPSPCEDNDNRLMHEALLTLSMTGITKHEKHIPYAHHSATTATSSVVVTLLRDAGVVTGHQAREMMMA